MELSSSTKDDWEPLGGLVGTWRDDVGESQRDPADLFTAAGVPGGGEWINRILLHNIG